MQRFRLRAAKNFHDFFDRVPIARGDQPSPRLRLGKPVQR